MNNPLVAEKQDSTTAFSGVPILESVQDTSKAIESGDWSAGVMGGVGTALDAISMAMDPFGSIFAAGVGWLIEHVGPVSDALDALTGDADQISAHSETWKNVHDELADITAELTRIVEADTAGWTGEAGDAYRKRTEDTSTLLEAASKAAEGASSAMSTAGEIVGAVRTLVRDIIAELVGHLISWALQVAATLGIAMAWVVPQVVAEVSKVAARIGKHTSNLVKAFQKLTPLLKKLDGSFGDTGQALKNIKSEKPGPAPTNSAGGKGGLNDPMKDKKPKPDEKSPPPRDSGPNNGPASTDTTGAKPDGERSPGPKDDSKGGTDKKDPTSDRPNSGPQNPAKGPEKSPKGTEKSPKGPEKPPKGTEKPANTNTNSAKEQPPREKQEPGKGESQETKHKKCEGDPVDVATGEVLVSQCDLRLPHALELVLERTHLSSYRAGRWFGSSWASTVDCRLEVDSRSVRYFAPDGARLVYPLPDTGTAVLPKEGARRPLTRVSDGTYTLFDPLAGRTLTFAPRGGSAWSLSLTRVDDGVHRIDIEHDAHGAPRMLRHSAGYLAEIATESGRVVHVRVLDQDSDLAVVVMRYEYDPHGRLVRVIDSTGLPQQFDYDDAGRVTGWQDRNGYWYRYVYDASGRCVRTVGDQGYLDGVFTYDRDQLITTFTNSVGHTKKFHLNERNQVVCEVDQLGNATSSTWDESHQLLSRTDPLGRTTRFEYTAEGALTALVRPDGCRIRIHRWTDEVLEIEAEGTRWYRSYTDGELPDPYTQQLGVAQDVPKAEGNVAPADSVAAEAADEAMSAPGARAEFDLFGRPRVLVDRDGGTTRLTWNVEGRLLSRVRPSGGQDQWRYDPEGNQHGHVDAFGQLTKHEYAPFDLLVASEDATGARTTYQYDTETRLCAVTNPNGQTWRYGYDPAGRVITESDFDGRTFHFEYDAAGQLQRAVNGAGEQVEYGYDVLGNVVWRRTATETVTFGYDLVGRLVNAANADATIEVERDEHGRVTSHTVNGRAVTFDYDESGGVRRRTPSGVDSYWSYDTGGRPEALEIDGHQLVFAHDRESGVELSRRIDGDAVLSQRYDSDRRLVEQNLTSSGTSVLHRRFGYRPDGTLAAVEDGHDAGCRYELDPAGRVTEVARPSVVESYRYDGTGNIVAEGTPNGLVPRRYRGTMLTELGAASYEYDGQGRLVCRRIRNATGVEQVWRFAWNASNRLVSVTTPDGSWWVYRYDPLGRRIAKQRMVARPQAAPVVAEQVDFVWDGNLVVEQRSAGRVLTWEHHPDDERPVVQVERTADGERRFTSIVTDQIGSPAELVDESGRVVWRAQSTLWGRVTGGDTEATPLRFPGQQHDAETGLHYNVYRYYDPVTGRYLCPDPLGLAPAPNPVAYVPNPLVACDPLGLTSPGGDCSGGTDRGKKRDREEDDSRNVRQTRSKTKANQPSPPPKPDPTPQNFKPGDTVNDRLDGKEVKNYMDHPGGNTKDSGGYTKAQRSEQMGDAGAYDYLKKKTGKDLPEPKAPGDPKDFRLGKDEWPHPVRLGGSGVTDMTYWDGKKLHVIEAKGGSSQLGERTPHYDFSNKDNPTWISNRTEKGLEPLPQGSKDYLRDVGQEMKNSKHEDNRSAIGDAIMRADKEGKIDYTLVRTDKDAKVTLEEQFLKPKK